MRVLHIDRQRQWAGQQKRTLGAARLVAAAGHEVLFACTPGAGYETHAAAAGFRCFSFWMRGFTVPAAVLRLARIIRREKIDVVDAHNSLDHNLSILATRIARRGVVVRTKHNHTHLRNRASRYTYVKLTRRVIAISGFVKGILLADGIPEAQIDLIPSAIDTAALAAVDRVDRAAARAKLGIPEGAFAIGTTSRRSHRKGLGVLSRAIAKLIAGSAAPVVYVCAGKEPEKLRQSVARHGVPDGAIRTPGFVERVVELYAALDCFALPSRDEALGVALLEATAAGLPAIASNVGGIPEIVVDGESGLLVPPEDPGALAAAIDRLRRDPGLARRLGAAARARTRALYDLADMGRATERCYRRALGERVEEPPRPGVSGAAAPATPRSG